MRHTLLLLFLVACTDLPVDEWSGAEVDDADGNAQPTHPLEDCPGNAPGGRTCAAFRARRDGKSPSS